MAAFPFGCSQNALAVIHLRGEDMSLTTILRSIAGVLGGYALMGLLITLVQETWLGGISFRSSSAGVLLVGGFFTFLCAVVAGGFAGWVAGHHPVHHAAAM